MITKFYMGDNIKKESYILLFAKYGSCIKILIGREQDILELIQKNCPKLWHNHLVFMKKDWWWRESDSIKNKLKYEKIGLNYLQTIILTW